MSFAFAPGQISLDNFLRKFGILYLYSGMIGIVRNPWEWQVSMYDFLLENTTNPERTFMRRLGSFENYIRWRCKYDHHLQKEFLFSRDDVKLVDFIGNYDNPEADFQKICEHIGIIANLPRLNRSPRHKSYQAYYMPETIKLVRTAFAPDIELFGYDFEYKNIGIERSSLQAFGLLRQDAGTFVSLVSSNLHRTYINSTVTLLGSSW